MGRFADSGLDRLLTGSTLRHPRVARKVLLGLAILLLLSVAVLVLVVRSMDATAVRIFGHALACSSLLAVVPVMLLYFLDRRERESPWLVAIAILWGALIATGLALPLNTWIIGAVARWLESNQEIAAYLGPKGALLMSRPTRWSPAGVGRSSRCGCETYARAPTSACTACVMPSVLRWNMGKRRRMTRVVCT